MRLRTLPRRPVLWSVAAAAVFSLACYICFAIGTSIAGGNTAFLGWFVYFLLLIALPGGALIGALLGVLLALYRRATRLSTGRWVRAVGTILYAALFAAGFSLLWLYLMSPGPQLWAVVVAALVGAAAGLAPLSVSGVKPAR